MREEARADKTPRPGALASGVKPPKGAPAEGASGHRKANVAAPAPTTKRQKSG